ncbi:uncharacterized protein LOC117579675 [Drosophila guanche]|uniref:Uncharacterized protein n=1 Tax=Drosophila guanche TaxID=7266 RepID=A0A3B0JQ33_DROGU|nr:uncharacterized protein LOC117579675 [Drosophila guanche]SPP74771.1 Hypothetical predicted protein [Drosophila guanche]
MLTNARAWELKSSQLLLLLLLLLLLCHVLRCDGASVTWGHVSKYASPLYTEDVYLTPETPGGGRDVVYGSQNDADGYRITAVHVEDLSSTSADAQGDDGDTGCLLTEGGIGQQFVVLHCQRGRQVFGAVSVHLQVSIYGLEL